MTDITTGIHSKDIDLVIAVARGAGDLARRMYANGQATVRQKSSAIDLVTAADVAAENFVREALERLYPGVALWGEESNQPPAQEEFWLLDPIDGTTNFAHNVGYCAVNIALQQGVRTLLAVTYHIGEDCAFYAVHGGGAYQRLAYGSERRLQTSARDSLQQALLITGFPYHRAESIDNNGAEFAYFMPRTACVRNFGSAALDLAQVAMGAADGYWEAWLNPWDLAAGALLVREAGGTVTTYEGAEWTIHDNHIVASNGSPALHAALLEGIRIARASLAETRLAVFGERTATG